MENLKLLQTRPSLKTRLSLFLDLTMTPKKNFKFFFQKIEPTYMPDQHVKEQPDPSTYGREKGCLTLSTNRETPCIKSGLERKLE